MCSKRLRGCVWLRRLAETYPNRIVLGLVLQKAERRFCDGVENIDRVQGLSDTTDIPKEAGRNDDRGNRRGDKKK